MQNVEHQCHYCGKSALAPEVAEFVHDLSGAAICEDCALHEGYIPTCAGCGDPLSLVDRDGSGICICTPCYEAEEPTASCIDCGEEINADEDERCDDCNTTEQTNG